MLSAFIIYKVMTVAARRLFDAVIQNKYKHLRQELF